ncbi:hypothetical protein [Actinomadura sp. SCN-SB]|uniref:hypothetical protein n=1 Tax=Actinomadura sp. SCN-SB TaxID=3373092 RepID=UPI003750200B
MTVLDTWTETADRTPSHEELRSAAPAGVELYDYWQVLVLAAEDVDGAPAGVTLARLARCSTTPPDRLPGHRAA